MELFVLNNIYMKQKYIKNQSAFNIRMNEQEFQMIKTLKEKHSINISGAFKNFLKDLLEKLEK